jgi:hypothetical protein
VRGTETETSFAIETRFLGDEEYRNTPFGRVKANVWFMEMNALRWAATEDEAKSRLEDARKQHEATLSVELRVVRVEKKPILQSFACWHVQEASGSGQLVYCRMCRCDGKDGFCDNEKHMGIASVGSLPGYPPAKQRVDGSIGTCMSCERPVRSRS